MEDWQSQLESTKVLETLYSYLRVPCPEIHHPKLGHCPTNFWQYLSSLAEQLNLHA
jgi:hypothetical protein